VSIPEPRIATPGGRRTRLLAAVALLASLASLLAAWWFARRGLTLSHYDAKAHLVVARRIFDSLTPGWRQIGAVWLPLPHVLNAIPVQVDAFYRTGASGTFVSMVSFVVATTSLSWLVLQGTRSAAAALATAVVFASDPNVLYLQSTPMTEPLLLALVTLATALTYHWLGTGSKVQPLRPGLALTGACLTRYEAWPIAAALVGLSGLVVLWRDRDLARAVRDAVRLAVYPIAAILGFLCLSRATVGEWFVTGGFFVADNPALHKPLVAAGEVWWGLGQVAGRFTVYVALFGAAIALALALFDRKRAPIVVAGALAACAALPWYAFVNGHPFRVRYMVVLAAAVAAWAGLGVGLLPRRVRLLGAAVLVAVALVETPPTSARAPMIEEAQWDVPNSTARQAVATCLAGRFDRPRDKILVSMGSLAHFMQELSRWGFALDDFVHEGVGEIWPAVLDAPRRHVQWILFEEQAEGGDMLTALRTQDPSFVEGFEFACGGGGVTLYRRRE
jgi:hypothetical protein